MRRNGLNISIPESFSASLKATTLFDGNDGLFKELLGSSKIYGEYGCGKSTEFALKYTDASICSVDTSEEWACKIRSVAQRMNSERLNLKWVDVGLIGDWGYPVSFTHRHKYVEYAEYIWGKSDPDLVLIDGRFRVYCFLTSLKFSAVGTKLLFDDYVDRPFYHVAEDFCPRVDSCGRQVLFEVTEKAKASVSHEVLLSFQNVVQ